ncbi:unnamed protein product [Bursaphelenchus xylophilus]|uniref:Phospholipid-transporting ATPase n=1 Tax=Bursaphelenchus xylophilus TaxID=6326 RepID=A0A1I7S9A2_BURXY|nr:unnamed protein product [Bursaphelenchus xylophilus]CAG9100473.1 unnamed protein product [Bursaphelenchus xylophilus]
MNGVTPTTEDAVLSSTTISSTASSDKHHGITVTKGPPVHRRNSSQWIPPNAPIYERALDLTSLVASKRFWKSGVKARPDRVIEPNWLTPHIPRYHLQNYRLYSSNKIRTSKYTWLTFLPKNLFEQFHRWANIYFIIIMAMNWIPQLQAFSKYLGMIPVVAVLSMTAIKDFLEDWRRKRADKRLNHNTVHVWDNIKKRFRKTLWELVIVGDLVHISSDEKIPADIVLIRSSDPQGCAFVETSNLDGENNLKQKVVPNRFKNLCLKGHFDPSSMYVKITVNPPDNRMNHINGKIEYENGENEKITKENVILRGCQLKNTSFAEGIVIYTGAETKLMLSNGPVRYKRSSIERMTNYFILFCVLLLIIMLISSGICSIFWLTATNAHERHIPYVVLFTSSAVNDGLINMAAYILVYQTLIPLSLYISIEIIKLGQNYLMTQDLDLYDQERDKKLLCRSLNIPEELGQVKYILSDKTGTLTENKMVFKSCTISGEIFEAENARRRTRTFSNMNEEKIEISPKLQKDLQTSNTRDEKFFMLMNMAVCNTVMVRRRQQLDDVELGYFENNIYNVGNSAFYVPIETIPAGLPAAPEAPLANPILRQFTFSPTDLLKRFGSLTSLSKIFTKRETILRRLTQKADERNYDAESPDELALVKAADEYGFTLVNRSATDIRLALPRMAPNGDFFQEEVDVKVLKVLGFDSNRKRMSIVVRSENKLLLLTKGADEQIFPNLESSESPELIEETRKILNDYGRIGLRTLVMAMKELDEEEFEDWLATREFVESIDDDEAEQLLSESSSQLEVGLHLLGVTAIEDRLQMGVTDTISALRNAGIQIWVLTGDKCETAVNIAKSCHLFNKKFKIHVFRELQDLKDFTDTERKINAVFSSEIVKLIKEGNDEAFRVIERCEAIVCFRMTPAEKADVVNAVKIKLKGKTLAIGDGANDVPMILGADVGIGVSGHEGLQAVMASDFAISRFRFLRKLLLVHGHWNYYRLSNAIMYFLEKNAVFVLVIFWGQMFMGFSSGFFIDPIYSMLYPILFTSVQPIVYSIFDQDLSKETLLKYPKLYETGREARLCTYRNFGLSMLDAFYQSAILFFIPFLCFSGSEIRYWQFAFVLSTSMFLVNSIHLAILIRRWTFPLLIVQLLFVGVHFSFFIMYTYFVNSTFNTKDPPLLVAYSMLKEFQFWSCVLLTVIIAVIPRFIITVVQTQFWPDLHEITLRQERHLPIPIHLEASNVHSKAEHF